MNILIRELRAGDDLNAVLSLCKGFFAEYDAYHKEFFVTDNLSDDHLSGRFLNSITSDSSSTIIALVDNAIIGYTGIIVREQPDFYMVKCVGTISGLMVEADFRRQGIATKLLEAAKHWFKQRGVKYFTVYTASRNAAAVEFYRRSGMQPLHTTLIGEIA